MNLGKLLGAGKSVFGGQAPAEYRKNKHVYLPKFNDGKNPFSSKAPEPAVPANAPVPAPAAAKMVVAAPIVAAPMAVAPVTVAPLAAAPVAPTPVGAPALVPAKTVFSAKPAVPVPAKTAPAKTARAAHWAERLNQLWSAAKPAPQKAQSGPMPNVQPELLSLNAVKVVHNDLSDADVEVVPMRSRTVQAKTAPMPTMAMDFAGEPALKSA